MDPGPDSKRPRLSSWSNSSTQGVSLPHPHPQPYSNSHSHPPPPPSQPHSQSHYPHPITTQLPHHHQQPAPPPSSATSTAAAAQAGPPPPSHSSGPPSAYPPYSARSAEQSSAPQTPILGAGAPPPSHVEADRRHHDQEPAGPMHDPYRQHPPPQSYQPYPHPPRDPSVKRESYDDLRRPNSTGHAPDGMPQTPHPIPPPQHPALPPPNYDGQPRHMTYDNGPSVMPPTPGGYRAPSYPPPTPVTHQSSYDQHGSYSSAGEPFYSVYSSSGPAKKKNTRASQACDQCRQLKAKCDETKPCKTCRDKGSECRYRETVPKATDKAQADILDGISLVQTSLEHLTHALGRLDDRVNKIEGVVLSTGGRTVVKRDPATDDDYKPAASASHRPNGVSQSQESALHNEHSRERFAAPERVPLQMMAEDEMEAEPGPPVPPGEPAIPINHTTLAGLLLDWPSIREMTKHHLEKAGVRFVSEFPISQEQRRGLLMVYGRGEDCHHHSKDVTDHGILEASDDVSDSASPSPAADWGQLGGLSPPDQVEYKGGVLSQDGTPDFSESKVWTYVESFKENILNMHPIIQPDMVDYWVRSFLESLPPQKEKEKSAKPQVSKPSFAVQSEAAGSKRKRSQSPDGSKNAYGSSGNRIGRPYRSIHSAVVLTILALGKICLYRDRIPDVLQTPDNAPQGSPHAHNGVLPSPGQSSPPSYTSQSASSNGQPSPADQERGRHSRRSSMHGHGTGLRQGYSLKRNYEVIPGLEYFAFATDILGNHQGAYNHIKDVYANIFACLYHGQLGRPMESFAFIHRASHKLQVIMRPSLDKMRRMKRNSEFIQDAKYNQLALTFWTCLQLESDLIAELQLPPSGLLSYEDDMPHPNMSMLKGFNQSILDSYPGQLYLRTHLNSIHRMFYAPEDPNKPGKDKFKNVGLVADAVSDMTWVAPSFAFREDDIPADDILSARLRAKYWGAQVITYRPFIRQFLQFSHAMRNHPASPNMPQRTEFREDVVAPTIHPNTRSYNEIDRQVVELAKKGIKALVESTRAFHGLGEKRPVITNVFGTAHAQWGNLLVLSAAFKDPGLRYYVNEDILRGLFQRTIHFLNQSATMTSSLRVDMHILEGLQRDLFYSTDPRANSSFSSHASVSGHTPQMPTALTPHGESGMHEQRQFMRPPSH